MELSKYNGQGFALEGNPSQGPFVKCTLFIEKGVIQQSEFQTYRCGIARRICNTLSKMSNNKNLQEAICISVDCLHKETGKIPLGKQFCLNMAISSLQKAISSVVGE